LETIKKNGRMKSVFRNLLTSSIQFNKGVLSAIFILVVCLIIDVSLVKISDLIRANVDYTLMVVIFVVLGVVSILGQHIVLRLAEVKEIKKSSDPSISIFKMIRIFQYSLMLLIIVVMIQVIGIGQYSTVFLILTAVVSYGISITILALLTKRFFAWFRTNHNLVVFLYGLSSAAIAVNAGLTVALLWAVWLESPRDVGEHTANLTRIFIANSPSYVLNQIYFISYVVMFILTWVATVLLLRHYTQKLGRIKYWILVSLPLIYFVIQFPPLILQLFSPLLLSMPTLFSILVTLTFALSKPVGGILFGIAFFTLARNLPRNTAIRGYMVVSTFGLILLFISNQALIWVYVPYPPFGMATVPFMGISSYLVFVGIYSSAISVAQDTTIRQTIRRYAIKESQLLDSIGTSEMEQEATNKMLEMTRASQHKMTYETGVESLVNEQDMKDYLSKVLQEIQKAKERKTRR
jgi:hypothetical protein